MNEGSNIQRGTGWYRQSCICHPWFGTYVVSPERMNRVISDFMALTQAERSVNKCTACWWLFIQTRHNHDPQFVRRAGSSGVRIEWILDEGSDNIFQVEAWFCHRPWCGSGANTSEQLQHGVNTGSGTQSTSGKTLQKIEGRGFIPVGYKKIVAWEHENLHLKLKGLY